MDGDLTNETIEVEQVLGTGTGLLKCAAFLRFAFCEGRSS